MSSDERLDDWKSAERHEISHSFDPTVKRLLDAAKAEEKLTVVYHGGDSSGSRRSIQPRRLFRVSGHDSTYLDAYCETRCEHRVFRVDRLEIQATEVLRDEGHRPHSRSAISIDMSETSYTSSTDTDPLPKMIEALALEVAAIKKSGGSTSIELFGGVFVARTNGQYLYKFLLTEEVQLRDDTPIRVQFGQQDVDGCVVSLKGGVLVLALEEDLGQKLPRVRLVADDSFLIEQLRKRLSETESGEAHFNRTAARRVVGLERIKTATADITEELLHGRPSLNDVQVEAVRKSLASDTTFVWGPPGTGKTTTLARIVEGHYLAGRSVLLVSNTNIAVDTALEKIADRLGTDPAFQAGAVIRYGPVVKDELLQKYGEQVVLDKIVARLSESVQREHSALRAEVSKLLSSAAQLREIIATHEQAETAAHKLQREQRSHERLHEKLQTLNRELQASAESLDALKRDCERAKRMGRVRRFFAGLNPDRLVRDIAKTEAKSRASLDAMTATESEYAMTTRAIENLEAHHRALAAQAEKLPSVVQCKRQLSPLESKIEALNQKITELEMQLEQIRQEVLNRCRIMATTVYRTYLKGQVERSFDVVVIDEASMLMLPMSFYAAGLASQSVTVAGDFRQLPAIVKSSEQLAEQWLKMDVFFKCGIPRQIVRSAKPDYLVALQTQYRMNADICGMVNDLFYSDHPLLTDRPSGLNAPPLALLSAPLIYIDTASMQPWASMRMGTFSRYNLLHALLVKKLIAHLSRAGYLPPPHETNDRIGAVTPFGAQTRLIHALVQDALGGAYKSVVATVHRFQGNEKDTMLVDLTDSTGCSISKFMKGSSLEDDGARLLNVALSRARDHIILIANFDYLRRNAPPNGVVLSLLDVFAERGDALDLTSVLPLDDDDWIDGLHRIAPPNLEFGNAESGVFDEGTFYPVFARDLEQAKDSVVILSPFMSARGTSRWVDHFRIAMQRGASIRIITRPSVEFGGAPEEEVEDAITQLRALGAAIDLRARMHEKVAFIDKRILWLGSLNILSHRDTSECMIRLTGDAVCDQVFEFICTPSARKEEFREPGDSENPPCPDCSAATTLKEGRFGIYFECIKRCGGKVDSRRRPGRRTRPGPRGGTSGRTVGGRKGVRVCPEQGCGGQLVRRDGRFGPFLGCSNYPRCRHTENH